MKLLTEAEAAAVLRCSRSKVKRLRLTGALAYVPGRPVTIEEEALAAYVERATREAAVAAARAAEIVRRREAPTEAEQAAAARELARKSWLRKARREQQ